MSATVVFPARRFNPHNSSPRHEADAGRVDDVTGGEDLLVLCDVASDGPDVVSL